MDLIKIPKLIKNKEEEIYNLSKEYNEYKLKKELLEFEEMKKINCAVDENNKKLFSNNELRNAELTRRMQDLETAKELKNNMTSLLDNLEMAKIELRYLQNNFSAQKIVSQISMVSIKTLLGVQ